MSSAVGTSGPRVLVVGCGAIGGVVAAHLFEQGVDTTALTTNALIADAINGAGFTVRGEGALGHVRGSALRSLSPRTQPFDYVLLATQPTQVEDAARTALPFLAEQGRMVCFQNGLCEERVGAIVGQDRTIGAIVAWGASMIEPGIYDRTSAGGFALGRNDGALEPQLELLARLLEAVGPVVITENLRGARWSKLAINCAISSIGTAGGDRLGALMRHRFVRRLALEVMTETRDVAKALNVRLEKVAGTLDHAACPNEPRCHEEACSRLPFWAAAALRSDCPRGARPSSHGCRARGASAHPCNPAKAVPNRPKTGVSCVKLSATTPEVFGYLGLDG